MGEIQTYGDIYKLFCERNPDVAKLINDYRPAGIDTIRIWIGKSGRTASFTATYVRQVNTFVVQHVDAADEN